MSARSPSVCRSPGSPLAAVALSIGVAAGLFPPTAAATITAVSNCNDGGTGSLRKAVTLAASGDTIDLSALPCSQVTLTTGEITVGVANLTLRGAGLGATRIDGNNHSRVFAHAGTGTLRIADLTVQRGVSTASGLGGCIYSKGSVRLDHARVAYCSVHIVDGAARGGGIYAQAGVLLYTSRVDHNTVAASGTGLFTAALAGGLYARGALVAKYSTIADNVAAGPHAVLGGLAANGNVTISDSTISGNVGFVLGGAYLSGRSATKPLRIRNSTISGNYSSQSAYGSGLAVAYPLVLSNSTITDNIEADTAHEAHGAGLFIKGSVAVEIESSIIGGNFLAGGFGTPSDLGGTDPNLIVSGGGNLITQAFVSVPPGTISGHQPKLAPLADNGGPTLTHLPLPDSLAINAGNNLSGAETDQRGRFYPRVFGASADIGAVEVSDVIFADGFD